MSRITSIVYGALITFLALDSMFLGFIPSSLLPLAVMLMGVLVLWTKIIKSPSMRGPAGKFISTTPRSPLNWFRRWFFGVALVFMGGLSYYDPFNLASQFNVYSFTGQLILIGIGVIYFLAGTSLGARQIDQFRSF